MYLPQFLVGMFLTSGIVGLWAYVATGSVWSAAGWTIVNLLILQIGYFAFVIRRVYKRTTADAWQIRRPPVMFSHSTAMARSPRATPDRVTT
ncbi:hypothetical protein FJ979_30220 [Mesorhizobium sp. B1-1-6]|nr:hypothetical protein FJ966_27825 [Mesorhizobium sp. B2-1-5]TPN30619.1 hypothetical protein FJ979_30220 [Mesorhizobium sp. B1-1-6]